jgi:outer membrane lipoprotein SlyB
MFAGTGDEQSATIAGAVAGSVYGSDMIGGKKLFVTVKVSGFDLEMAPAGKETSIW